MRTILLSGLVMMALVASSVAGAQTAGPSMGAQGMTAPATPALVPTLPDPVKTPLSIPDPPKAEAPAVGLQKTDTPVGPIPAASATAPKVELPKTGAASRQVATSTGQPARLATPAGKAPIKPKATAVSAATAKKATTAKHVAKTPPKGVHAKHATTVKQHATTGRPVAVKAVQTGKRAAPAHTTTPTTQPMLPRV